MLHWPRRLCVTLPLLIGRWVQKLGLYLSDMAAWLVGAGIILAILAELGWKHLDWLRDIINVIKERLS